MAKSARPKFQIGDRVSLAAWTPLIPAYGGKPFVGRSAVLRVSSITGKGTTRDPWFLSVTDDAGHFWTLPPDDVVGADPDARSHSSKRVAPAKLDREILKFLVESETRNASGPTGQWKVTDRFATRKEAEDTAAWRRRQGGNSRVRSHMNKAPAKDEVIARRKTYDDKAIALWSDGSLTWGGIGRTIDGSPNAKTPAAKEAALKAGWLVIGEVEVYDAEDVPRLIKAARKVAAKNGLPGDLRREFWKDAPLRPHWETYQTDRNGKPTIRTWRLPRVSHPGLVVWDRVTGAKRYEVMHMLGRGSSTLATTGVRFDTLPELATYLRETSALARKG